MTTRASIKKLHLKQRNILSDSINYPRTVIYNKKKNILINPYKSKSNKFSRTHSQSHVKDKAVITKSKNDTVRSSKILTPQNHNNIKERISSSETTYIKNIDNISLCNSIISKIEKITLNYNKNTDKLYYLLTKIDNYINSIINEAKNIINSNSVSDYDKIKITSLRNPLINNNYNTKKKLSLSKEFYDIEQSETENTLMKRKINKLCQKINDMEIKFKIDELNYFFCIGENQKKINELEKKLNLRKIDKLPKEELKKFLCFPHYLKFDIKEDINPKSIPMYNLRKHKNISSTNEYREKKTTVSYIDSGNKYFQKFFNLNKDIHINKEHNNNNENKDSNDYKDNYYSNIEDLYDKIKNNKNINENEDIKIDRDLEINEIEKTIKLGKQNFDNQIPIVDKYFGKKKSFFISHPKLNYIKSGQDGNKLTSWKIDNQLKSFPQQISKLRMSKSQKNAMIVFPSSFNETMANLEKLRTNKNFRSIENKFEEILKIKHKQI